MSEKPADLARRAIANAERRRIELDESTDLLEAVDKLAAWVEMQGGRVERQNRELDEVADELIAQKRPGWKTLKLIRERDQARAVLKRVDRYYRQALPRLMQREIQEAIDQ